MDVQHPSMPSYRNLPMPSLLPYNTPTLPAITGLRVPPLLLDLVELLPMHTPGPMGKLRPLLIP